MATARQKKLAEVIIKNSTLDKPLDAGEMLENAGYKPGSVNYPRRVIQSIGVQKVLHDYGFNEDNARKVVASVLLDENCDPNTRLRVADLVFKICDSYPKVKVSFPVQVDFDTERAKYEYVK
ncbi:MAG: hypothetical protein V1704_02420 [Candidatus Vogelbacteria bacterium]